MNLRRVRELVKQGDIELDLSLPHALTEARKLPGSMSDGMQFHAFDSFAGLPALTESDRSFALLGNALQGMLAMSEEKFWEMIRAHGRVAAEAGG